MNWPPGPSNRIIERCATTISNWSIKHQYTRTEAKGPGQRGPSTGSPFRRLRLSISNSASNSRTATSANCVMPPRSYAATRRAWVACQFHSSFLFMSISRPPEPSTVIRGHPGSSSDSDAECDEEARGCWCEYGYGCREI